MLISFDLYENIIYIDVEIFGGELKAVDQREK